VSEERQQTCVKIDRSATHDPIIALSADRAKAESEPWLIIGAGKVGTAAPVPGTAIAVAGTIMVVTPDRWPPVIVTIMVPLMVGGRPVIVVAASAVMVCASMVVIPTVTRLVMALRSVGERGAASDQ
jgi:hypothetical protein